MVIMETRNVESIFTIVGIGQRETQTGPGPGGMLRGGQRCDTGATRTPGVTRLTGTSEGYFCTGPAHHTTEVWVTISRDSGAVFYFLQFVLKSKDINLICVRHQGVPFQKVMRYSWITENILLNYLSYSLNDSCSRIVEIKKTFENYSNDSWLRLKLRKY